MARPTNKNFYNPRNNEDSSELKKLIDKKD